MKELLWLRFAHFTGWMVWVAGLSGMGLTLVSAARSKAAGILADTGAILAIVSGVYMTIAQGAFKQSWLHVKLLLVFSLIVLHVMLRMRMRKSAGGSGRGLLVACLATAILILFAAIVRPIGS